MTLSHYLQPAAVSKIFQSYDRSRSDWRRPHLGASLIGNPCRRALWFSFRWVLDPRFDGRMLRLFDTGNREEPRLVRDLRNAGYEIYDRDPETGKQFSVTISPHIGGSLDGIGSGFEESPRKWHVLEFKTHSEKSFNELQAKGVKEAKPLHYAQMQIYMLKKNKEFPGEFDRAMYFGVNKNTDNIHGERIKLDHMFAQEQIGKALAVVDSPVPPPGIGNAEKDPNCLFCPYHLICYGNEYKEVSGKWVFVSQDVRIFLEFNCRTCLHSTPINETRADGTGAWTCAAGCDIDKNERAGCSKHLFVPHLLHGWTVEDAGEGFVKYDKGKNIAGGNFE